MIKKTNKKNPSPLTHTLPSLTDPSRTPHWGGGGGWGRGGNAGGRLGGGGEEWRTDGSNNRERGKRKSRPET